MITDILAYFDGLASAENAAEAAFALALRHDAHVAGLHVSADAQDFVAREPMLADRQSLRAFAEAFDRRVSELEHAARSAFEAARERHGVADQPPAPRAERPTAGWSVVAGTPRTIVAQRARVADVVVVGRSGYGRDNPTVPVIESCLFDSGRPVLIAPPHPPSSVGAYIVIAWNRSAASARALAAAMPLLDRAERIRLVYVETGAKAGPSIDEAAAYLARHGVTAETTTMAPERNSVASSLLTDAQYADLLVMGAYSHTRFREVVLGGVTREMLQTAPIPVMMVH